MSPRGGSLTLLTDSALTLSCRLHLSKASIKTMRLKVFDIPEIRDKGLRTGFLNYSLIAFPTIAESVLIVVLNRVTGYGSGKSHRSPLIIFTRRTEQVWC